MARKVYKWSNVAVRTSTTDAIGAEILCSAVSKAAEAVCTVAAHTLAVGDYVWITASEGMIQLDNRIAQVKAQTATTVTLKGMDTTLFDTAVADKTILRKVSFNVVVTTATNVSSGGGGFEFLDTTTIHDGTRSQVPGLANAATFTFTSQWNPADAALAQLKKASDAQDPRPFFMQFGVGGAIVVFIGYVGANLLPGGQAQQIVTTDVAVTMFGSPTYY